MSDPVEATDYRSTVLRCYDGDDQCPVCRFIDGDHSTETLLAVIGVLDSKLAESEAQERLWLDVIASNGAGAPITRPAQAESL